jgi:chorismate mutase
MTQSPVLRALRGATTADANTAAAIEAAVAELVQAHLLAPKGRGGRG